MGLVMAMHVDAQTRRTHDALSNEELVAARRELQSHTWEPERMQILWLKACLKAPQLAD